MRKKKLGQLEVKMHNRREELLYTKLEREIGYVFELIDEDDEKNNERIDEYLVKIDNELECFYWLGMIKEPLYVYTKYNFESYFKPELFLD